MPGVLKVLAVCTEDPELWLGGMGVHCKELYRALARRPGVEIDLLTTGPGPAVKEFDGYRKWVYSHQVCQKPPAPGLRAVLQADVQVLRRLLQMVAEGYRWDVIHAHEWSSVQVAQAAREVLGIPIVSTMHLCMGALRRYDRPMDWEPTAEPSWSEMDLWIENQEGKLLVENQELILCSDAYVRIAGEQYPLDVIGKQAHRIYNGIDLEEWHPGAGDGDRARREHALEDRPIALFVGRIATMKGIEYLLEAVAAKDTGYQVVIAGEVNADTGAEDWNVTKRLRHLTARYPERLRWVGFQRDQALKDLYAAADCVLMPSTHEPFGIVALEAMAMGVPLIATGVDGLGEIVTEASGDASVRSFALIIKSRDPEAIILALRDMGSPIFRRSLREQGLARVRQFNWDAIAEQTLGVYRLAMEGYNACHAG